jgi:cytochrome c553
MRLMRVQLLLQSAIMAFVFSGVGSAEEAQTGAVSQKHLEAKMRYCEVCHGLEGRGFPGFDPIPRLAGQTAEYIESQLRGFAEKKRAFSIMINASHSLSPAMITALATNFSRLNPPPLGGAPKDLVGAGKKIYDEGVPDANVPPCASCHGAKAKGNGEFPRLAGQLYPYVVRQLTIWGQERRESESSIMAPIAQRLTKSQIDSVGAYISQLE